MPTFTEWYINNNLQPGNNPEPFFRDVMDRRRTMWGQTPESSYPDGYLGTMTRRGDKLLEKMADWQRRRPQTRGVHKGERIDPGDYFWPDEFGLMTGLRRQATTGLRHAPLLTGENVMPPGAAGILSIDPGRAGDLRPIWE